MERGGAVQLTGTSVISDGAFHAVAFRTGEPNKRTELYVDGVLEATYTEAIGSFTSWSSAAVGDAKLGKCDTAGLPGPRHFQGTVDELDLYSRALAAPEIKAIFDAGTAGKCPSPTTF